MLSIKNKNYQSTAAINSINIPSNLSPCPWPLQSGDTAIAATSPHFSSKKGKSAAQAIICPSLSTTMKEPNDWSSYKKRIVKCMRLLEKITSNGYNMGFTVAMKNISRKVTQTSSSVRLTNIPDSSKGWISCFIPEKSVTWAIRVPS